MKDYMNLKYLDANPSFKWEKLEQLDAFLSIKNQILRLYHIGPKLDPCISSKCQVAPHIHHDRKEASLTRLRSDN